MILPPLPLPNRWRRDIRPFNQEDGIWSTVWSMVVESDAVGQIMTFSTAVDIHEPGPYVLFLLGPNGLRTRISPGGTIEVPCTAPTMIFYWELQYDEGVPLGDHSFGSLKALYR